MKLGELQGAERGRLDFKVLNYPLCPSHRSCSNVSAEPLLYSLTTAAGNGQPQMALCVLFVFRFVF